MSVNPYNSMHRTEKIVSISFFYINRFASAFKWAASHVCISKRTFAIFLANGVTSVARDAFFLQQNFIDKAEFGDVSLVRDLDWTDNSFRH